MSVMHQNGTVQARVNSPEKSDSEPSRTNGILRFSPCLLRPPCRLSAIAHQIGAAQGRLKAVESGRRCPRAGTTQSALARLKVAQLSPSVATLHLCPAADDQNTTDESSRTQSNSRFSVAITSPNISRIFLKRSCSIPLMFEKLSAPSSRTTIGRENPNLPWNKPVSWITF